MSDTVLLIISNWLRHTVRSEMSKSSMEVSFNPPFRDLVRGVRAAYVMTYNRFLASVLERITMSTSTYHIIGVLGQELLSGGGTSRHLVCDRRQALLWRRHGRDDNRFIFNGRME